jgi:tetratricopeptide (TPR) repeat protein
MMRMSFFFKSMVCLSVLAFSNSLNAQIMTPSASVTTELKTKVGLTDVALVYSRPSMRGRGIFGKEVVPFGAIWRTGANSVTKLSFSDDFTLGGAALKKGDYALLTLPNAAEWKIMLYKYESSNWASYQEKTPDASFMAASKSLAENVESFTIDVNNYTNESATIDLSWEKTKISLPLAVNTDAKVMASIDKVMAGPSASDLYAAGAYYHDSGKDLKKALEMVQKANASNAQYWTLRKESLILADLGRKEEAVAVATKSLELAKKAGNNDYIRMNEASIAAWKK